MIISRANEILKEDNISPEEKLLRTFMAMRIDNQVANWIPEEMHKTENALLHQKTFNQSVTALAPILAKIIEEGIEKKAWSCRYPLEYMQIFLASALTLTDEGIFQLDSDSQLKVMGALISVFG